MLKLAVWYCYEKGGQYKIVIGTVPQRLARVVVFAGLQEKVREDQWNLFARNRYFKWYSFNPFQGALEVAEDGQVSMLIGCS